MEGRASGEDGKRLEALVATIEKLLLPMGFDVKTNTRVYNDGGVQLGEFDVEIRGRLGSTEIAWLIECRNRPSEGPARGAWIEQLVGRRSRFNFDKVTAVSTTGFAEGAIEYANRAGIDLREVNEIAPEVANWLAMRHLQSVERRLRLDKATIRISETESTERLEAATGAITAKRLDEAVIRSTQTGEVVSLVKAFDLVISENPSVLSGVLPNQPGKSVELRVHYPSDESHFVVDTAIGSIRIIEIDFAGEVSIVQVDVPLSQAAEYRQIGREEAISQSAAFVFPVRDVKISLEMHRLMDSGETHLAVRPLGVAVPKSGPAK
jgi:Restriction endonuclease